MSTIYDVYPFSRGELPEFEVMHPTPTREDTCEFVAACQEIVRVHNADAGIIYTGDEQQVDTDLWLPEGIVSVYILNNPEFGCAEAEGVRVYFSICHELQDADITRDVEVVQYFSRNQKKECRINYLLGLGKNDPVSMGMPEKIYQKIPFNQAAILTDYGVQVDSLDSPEAQAFRAILDLRSDDMVDTLVTQPGTLTEDIATAEEKSNVEGLVKELASAGELENFFPDVNEYLEKGRHTVCSQRTMKALTSLLRQYTDVAQFEHPGL